MEEANMQSQGSQKLVTVSVAVKCKLFGWIPSVIFELNPLWLSEASLDTACLIKALILRRNEGHVTGELLFELDD